MTHNEQQQQQQQQITIHLSNVGDLILWRFTYVSVFIYISDGACGPQVVNQYHKHRILPHIVKRNLNFIQFILLCVAGNTL
jgi:hypothetical protein